MNPRFRLGMIARAPMLLPIREWLAGYEREWLSGDLIAGLTVTAATIPAALAYAELAGLPAVAGLYASVVPALLYALLGTSRQLQIGPGSTLSILVAASLGGALVAADRDQAIVAAALLALIAGGLLLGAGLLRLGFVSDFLSEPVPDGVHLRRGADHHRQPAAEGPRSRG